MNMSLALRLPRETTSERPTVVRGRQFVTLLAWKCASRHNDSATSKSAPKLRCFVHFDFGMCFAPQRSALFRHLNFQKWSEHGVFCTFWLGNVLRATTACNSSSLIWPDGSAPAALASLLFDPAERQSFWSVLPSQALETPQLGTFSGTLLNPTWLCAKAWAFSGTFSKTFSGTLLNPTWLCTKPSRAFSDPAPAPVHTGAILGWRPH